MATKVADGGCSVMTAGFCGRAMPVSVAICERYGQLGELARKLGRSSVDTPAMPEIPDAQ